MDTCDPGHQRVLWGFMGPESAAKRTEGVTGKVCGRGWKEGGLKGQVKSDGERRIGGKV